MKRFDTDLSGDQLKEMILDAADKRFKAVGFKKTAMAEIAADVGMSTANLYRYFPHKIDIAEAFALRCFEDKEKILSRVIEQASVSVEEELRAFALALLHYNHQQMREYPAINDIVVALCDTRPSLVERKRQGEATLLTGIIQRGVDQANWQCADIEKTSKAMLASWILFITPTFMHVYEIEELESLLNHIIGLLLSGLNERN